jgi:hypothetical protein
MFLARFRHLFLRETLSMEANIARPVSVHLREIWLGAGSEGCQSRALST